MLPSRPNPLCSRSKPHIIHSLLESQQAHCSMTPAKRKCGHAPPTHSTPQDLKVFIPPPCTLVVGVSKLNWMILHTCHNISHLLYIGFPHSQSHPFICRVSTVVGWQCLASLPRGSSCSAQPALPEWSSTRFRKSQSLVFNCTLIVDHHYHCFIVARSQAYCGL